MLAPAGSDEYICLDAGTLNAGLAKAVNNKVFDLPKEEVLKKYIKGYCISHSHLDHLSGLITNSPDDTSKTIYALAGCIKTFETHYFTWQSWANFGDAGESPALKKYHYETLIPGEEIPLANTTMTVKAFELSHSNLTSTAFLIRSREDYLLYLGDTGADATEKSDRMQKLWQALVPLVKSHRLKAIMIETSFPDEQPDKTLFGHFTPKWLMAEFQNFATLCGAENLKGFNVVITHLKPPQYKINRIKAQLKAENKLGLHLIFPEQGKPLNF
ncbi:3',5'-cyclic-nucleotide phosphodiesterase [Mucilaginibacter sp. RS28]|uniref:3',5'-cyclic-nucleotide phosphodiesterase n=2 Tax=Mucilaginibacter straminoryzae TaxID=2932774 RepID=A0A9X1X2B3_9SPHI|nr:3',5'-cyclic-nucleotide phosphodiesterase [Mucilaginibacter straminoryzae]